MNLKKIDVPQDPNVGGFIGMFCGFEQNDGLPGLSPDSVYDSGDSLPIARRIPIGKAGPGEVTAIAIADDSPWSACVVFLGGRVNDRHVVSVGAPFIGIIHDDFITVAPYRSFRPKWVAAGVTTKDHIVFGAPGVRTAAAQRIPPIRLSIYRGSACGMGIIPGMGRAPYAAAGRGEASTSGDDTYIHVITDGRRRWDVTVAAVVNGTIDYSIVGYSSHVVGDGGSDAIVSIMKETTLASGSLIETGGEASAAWEYEGSPFVAVYILLNPSGALAYSWRYELCAWDH